jgi:anthranilate 1,2-dioxygenase (deaminating, decarboxylating) large subunit
MRATRKLIVLAAVTAGLALTTSAPAYDLPSVNLGFTSFLDGGPPAGPGFYFQEYLQFYHVEKFADANGGRLALPGGEVPKLDVYVSLNQLIYQSDQSVLLGGKWGVDLIVPVVNFDLDSQVLSDNGAGIGDVLIGPYIQWDPIMGKNGPVFMHRIEFQMICPTGRYSDEKNLNPGSNFFSVDPYWSGTWFVTPQLTTSWRLHYLWNDDNTDPNKIIYAGVHRVQAGQAVHANFAADYEVVPHRLNVGVNGYYLKQITDTQADGHNINGSREQIFGIGPGAVYHFSQNDHLFFNVYFEMAAKNRTEGQRYILRWTHHF